VNHHYANIDINGKQLEVPKKALGPDLNIDLPMAANIYKVHPVFP
jgi:hypothetical protein